MSRTLVEVKRKQIEKERHMAEQTAKEDAAVKLAKLNNELLYTQGDLDEADSQWSEKWNAREDQWSDRWAAKETHWAWRMVFAVIITAMITALILHVL